MKKVLLISAIAMTLLSCSKGQAGSDPQPTSAAKIKGELTITVTAPALYVLTYAGKTDTTAVQSVSTREFNYVVGADITVKVINAQGKTAKLDIAKDGVVKASANMGLIGGEFVPVTFNLK